MTASAYPLLPRAEQVQTLYPLYPAQVQAVNIKLGDTVRAGDLMLATRSPNLEHRMELLDSEITQVRERIASVVSNSSSLEQRLVLQQKLTQLEAEQQGLANQISQLDLVSEIDGVIDAVIPLTPGQWLSPDTPLMTVRPTQPAWKVVAFATDQQIHQLKIGKEAKWLSTQIGPTTQATARVSRISYASVETFPYPELLSTQGGPIAANEGGPRADAERCGL